MSDIESFLDPYNDLSAIFDEERCGVISGTIDVTKIFDKTREVMERIQFDQDTDVSFEDIADYKIVLGMLDAGFGTKWINHIGIIAGDIISRNYNLDASLAPLTTTPSFSSQFTMPDSAWDTGRKVIDYHANGFITEFVTDGTENIQVAADVLLTTFLMYCHKISVLTAGGYTISR